MAEHQTAGAGRHNDASASVGESTDDVGEIKHVVDFARLLARSSLGTPEAQRDRITGSRELAEFRSLSRAGAPNNGRSASAIARFSAVDVERVEVDLRIANELELRGYTFEAELRYRRHEYDPRAVARLAPLVEAKGRRLEAWGLYVRAAQSNDTNALLRLAVICHQRGDRTWAQRLLQYARETLSVHTMNRVRVKVRDLATGHSRAPSYSLYQPAGLGPEVDDSFAVGSMLLIVSERSDLARLAYSSALARGHAISALSLMDIGSPTSPTPSPPHKDILLRHLSRSFDDETRIKSSSCTDELTHYLWHLKDRSSDSERLDVSSNVSNGTTGSSSHWSIRRWGQFAKLTTTLYGLRKLGCGERALEAIEGAAVEVGIRTQNALMRARPQDSYADTVRWIWDTSDRVLEDKRHAVSADYTLTVSSERNLPIGSGIVHRLHREFRRLSVGDLQALTLAMAGLDEETMRQVGGQRASREHVSLLRQRLVVAQQGEEHPSSHELLWAEVEEVLSSTSSW